MGATIDRKILQVMKAMQESVQGELSFSDTD